MTTSGSLGVDGIFRRLRRGQVCFIGIAATELEFVSEFEHL
jgi:hypothetical protein